MARVFLSGRNQVRTERQQILSGISLLTATLSADAVVIPEIATRALGWLTAGAIVSGLFGLAMLRVSARMQRLTKLAFDVTWENKVGGLASYAKAKDQIGTLGRALYALFRRDRNRMERNQRRIERDNQQRDADVRREQEYVERRKSILLAIGHQIRTPLANLKAGIDPKNETMYRELVRMERSIDALYEANRIEEGIRNGDVVVGEFDIAAYLQSLVTGYQGKAISVRYTGPTVGVKATYDDIVIQNVFDQLIENATRYATAGTDIEIRLTTVEPEISVEVFNQGPSIADTEAIFGFGVTDNMNFSNMGLGLFAAKVQMSAMGGEIRAENRTGGVAFVIKLAAV